MSYYIMTIHVEHLYTSNEKPELTAEVLVEITGEDDTTGTKAFNLGIDAVSLRNRVNPSTHVVKSNNVARTAVHGRAGLPEPVIANETGNAWILSQK